MFFSGFERREPKFDSSLLNGRLKVKAATYGTSISMRIIPKPIGSGFQWPFYAVALEYLDGKIVFRKTFQEHSQTLDQVYA